MLVYQLDSIFPLQMNLVEVQPLNVNNLWSVKDVYLFLEEKKEGKITKYF